MNWVSVPALFLLLCGIAMLGGTPSVFGADGAAAPRPRVAVVCLDDAERTTTLADLVQAELLAGGKVELVERAEFARILAEQKLSAAGLTSGASQIAVGKILRADALLLLERDRKAREYRIRLTETRYAAQLLRLTVTNQDAPTAAAAVPIVCRAVFAALAKLAVPPAQRVLISVVEIRNATLAKECDWVQTELPAALETALLQNPRHFVLDRERLREMLNEVQTTAGAEAAFSTGAVLIDGDLAVKPGVALGQGATPVVLAVRLRGGDLAEIGRVQVDTTLDKVRELLAKVPGDLATKVAALGPQKPVNAETEKRLLQEAAARAKDMGDTTRAVAFAETAHGLDAKDPQAVNKLLDTLYFKFAGQPGWGGDPKAMQNAVDTVLRMHELALLTDPRERDYAYSRMGSQQNSVLTSTYWSTLTDVQREQLRPVRQRLRDVAERTQLATPMFIVGRCDSFFDNAVEHNAYVCTLFQRMLDPAVTPTASRSWFIAQAFRTTRLFSMQPPAALEKARVYVEGLTRHEDCVVRYYALECATTLTQDRGRQKEYAAQALALLPHVLARDDLFARELNLSVCHPLPWNRPSAANGLRGWARSFGLDADAALARIVTLYDGMLDKGEFTRYALTRPSVFLPDMEPAAAIRLIDCAAALADRVERESGYVRTADMPPVSYGPFRNRFGDYLSAAATLRRELANRYFPELALADGPGRKVLLCLQSPAWQAIVAEVRGKWGEDQAQTNSLMPSRLLVDGDALWIAFDAPGVLLVQMDLASRRVLRSWIGEPLIDPRVRRASLRCSAICQWGDALCLGTAGHGVRIIRMGLQGSSAEVRLDDRTGDLPDPQVTALAPVGDDLYIGTTSGLWRYSRKTGHTELVADSKQQTVGRRLKPGTAVRNLVANRAGTRVYLIGTSGSPFPTLANPPAVYRFDTVSGEWTDLASTSVCQALAIAMGYGAPPPTRADPTPRRFDAYRAPRILDPETETVVPGRAVVPALPEDMNWGWSFCQWWEHVVFWKGDAIMIRCSLSGNRVTSPVWSLEQLSGLPMPASVAVPVLPAKAATK